MRLGRKHTLRTPSRSRLFEILESRVLLTTTFVHDSGNITTNGANLQNAINNAHLGDIIILDANVTYAANLTLPDKTTGSGTITIETSALASLPAGVRVGPSNASLMPKILSPVNDVPAVTTATSAHDFSFIGIEFSTTASAESIGELITLGTAGTAQDTLAQVPQNFVFDRCYIHGWQGNTDEKRGIGLNSLNTTISNCYISEIHSNSQDSQAISGYNGPGNYTITNNYLEAAGENVLFGGADSTIPNLTPTNITITNNYFSKPLSWDPNDPSYAGVSYSVKNILELKNAKNVFVDKNIFENNWVGGQSGYAIVFTPRNQDGTNTWATVANVTFTNNIVRHTAAGVNYLSSDNDFPSLTAHDITVTNNLFYDIGGTEWGGGGTGIQMVKATNFSGTNVTFEHNTFFDTYAILSLDSGQTANTPIVSSGMVFRNNIVEHGQYGVHGTGLAEGNAAINTFLPGAIWTGNIMIGCSSNIYPTGNFFPAADANVGFVNEANNQFTLATSSAYHNMATDGTDPGVNFPFVASINRANTNPSAGPTVNFTVTFTTSVTGVDASDFALVTSGLTGSSIASVTGSGSTYNVLVNTGTGNGTLGLNLVDNDSILNATGAPLAGLTTPNNGNFTGQVYNINTTVILPIVTAVYISSTNWSQAFLNSLATQSIGSSTFGYKIPTGSTQLNSLAWTGLNRISIQFNENVTIAQTALTVTGVNIANYPFAGFVYDSTNHVATWTLTSTLSTDKLLLTLNAAAVTDSSNNQLDGEWTDGVSTQSGNGTAGGNFAYHFKVLPGDVNGDGVVNLTDLTILASNWQHSVASVGAGDFTGDNFVDLTDLTILSSDWQTVSPAVVVQSSSPSLSPSLSTDTVSTTTPTTAAPITTNPLAAKSSHWKH